jgi:prepilin-type N-terminal cleavage/methylation domain-containing protein
MPGRLREYLRPRHPLLSLKRVMRAADTRLVATREDGYTLLELLVVVILIAILAAMALGFHASARDRSGDAAARSNIRVAVPAFEVYNADNDGSYAGMSLARLQALYSPGITGITVLSADSTSYCVRGTVNGRSWYKAGPDGPITTTACA